MALEFLRKSYDRYAGWADEHHLPPVPLLLILLLLALAAIGWAAKSLLPQPGIGTLSVSVISESGTAVPDARVQLYDEKGNFIDEQRSGKDGVAHFEGIAAGRVRVSVIKAGYDTATTVARNRAVSVSLSPEGQGLVPQKITVSLQAQDQLTQSPVSGVKIAYSVSGVAAEATTDATGTATLVVTQGKTVNARLSHPNYKEKSLSFAAEKGPAILIKIERLSGSAVPKPIGSTQPLEYGSLELAVLGPDGLPVSSGTASVLDGSTNSKIDSQDLANGQTTFDGLLVGSTIYISVTATGFLPYTGQDRLTVKKSFKHEVSLRTQAQQNQFKIRTADDNGKPAPAKLFLYTSANQLVLQKDSSGEALFSLDEIQAVLPNGADGYYVAASSSSLLPTSTPVFFAPFSQDYSLTLSSPTPDNSASLTVKTEDNARSPLANADVQVLAEGRVLTAQNSGSDASATFVLPKGAVYTLAESAGGAQGFGRLLLSSDASYELFMGGPVVFLLVSGVDALSSEPVSADYSLALQGKPYDHCSGSSCYLRIPQMGSGNVSAFAAGYAEYTTSVTAFAEDEKSVPVYLVALDKLEGLLVKWLGVTDAADQNATALQAGQEYTAKLLVASRDASATGVFFRLGSSASVQDEPAHLTGYDALTSPISSKNYSDYTPGPACPTPASGSSAKAFDLQFDGSLVQDVSFHFTVKENLKGKTQLPLYYRAYAVQDAGILRSPPDPQLGKLDSIPTLAGCYAASNSQTLSLQSDKDFQCSTAGCLTASLQQDGLPVAPSSPGRTIAGCDESCTTCANACDLSALLLHFEFEPSASFANADFQFSVSSPAQLSDLKKYAVNGQAATPLAASSPQGSFSKSKYYSADVYAYPQKEGADSFTLTLWPKGRQDQALSASLPYSLVASCGAGLRSCPDGSCQPLCLALPSITPTPVPTVEPCPSGQTRCLDGACRADCGYVGPAIPPKLAIPCTNDAECPSNHCNLETGYCSPGSLPTPTPQPSCLSQGGTCQGACGDHDSCAATSGLCKAGVCCIGACTPPAACNANSDCSSGICDPKTKTCSPTPLKSNAKCTLSAPASLQAGQSAQVMVAYQNLDAEPNSISIDCGNGRNAQATGCAGTTGSCSTLCPYPQEGIYPASASLQGISCDSASVAVSPSVAPSACTQPTDCGSEGFTGAPFCQNDDLYGSYTVPLCPNAFCTQSTSNRFISSCPNGCENGACKAPAPTPTTGPDAQVPDNTVPIDIVGGKLTTRLQFVALTPDPVFPADSAKLDLTAKCHAPVFTVNSPNGRCYDVTPDRYLLFRAKPINAACPLGMQGGQLQSDTATKLQVSCPGDASNTLELQVKVQPDNSVDATYARPESLSGSSAKLFHVVSQTQGTRTLDLGGQHYEFDRAGAQTYAWNGGAQGVQDVMENGVKWSSIFYDSASTLYPGISDQGPRKTFCSDAFCCADGFCTAQAASSAFDTFKQLAKNTFKKTAARHSAANLLPFKKATDKPFLYTTLFRLTEKAGLPSEVKLLDAPANYGCLDTTPKLYEVTASTKDGITWAYEARIARLYNYQYVPSSAASSCPNSPSTPTSPASPANTFMPESAGGYLAMCNFISSDDNCIKTSEAAGLQEIAGQAGSESQIKPKVIPSSFFPTFAEAVACKVGLSALRASKYATCMTFCEGGGLATLGLGSVDCPHECSVATEPVCFGGLAAKIMKVGPDIPGTHPFPRFTSLTCLPTSGAPACHPICTPRNSYVLFTTYDNQFYSIVHVGIDGLCLPDWKGGALTAAAAAIGYTYPDARPWMEVASTVGSSSILGIDVDTCTQLSLLGKIAPKQFQVVGEAGVTCSAIAEIKSLTSEIGAKSKVDKSAVSPGTTPSTPPTTTEPGAGTGGSTPAVSETPSGGAESAYDAQAVSDCLSNCQYGHDKYACIQSCFK